jgi:hypothetical protein
MRVLIPGALFGLALGTAAAPGVVSAAVRLPLLPRSQSAKSRHALGDWTLRIARNRFSGSVVCRLRSRNGKILYVADALGFRFNKHLDVMNAWVRVDGGEPYRWRNDLPELARLDVAIDGRNLDAPTDGIVWIPAASLADASQVVIQPRADRSPRVFRLHGFAGLRDIGRALGCDPETQFVR